MNLFIEHIDNEILRDKKKQRAIALKDAETEEAYCFLTVRLNLREPITKKASGGYEYLADTAVV